MHDKPTDAELENIFRHHPPKPGQADRYAAIRAKMLEAAKFVRDNTPASNEQRRAIGCLDKAMMNANAAIARNE